MAKRSTEKPDFDIESLVKNGPLEWDQESEAMLNCFHAFASTPSDGVSPNDMQAFMEKLFVEPKTGKSYSISKQLIDLVFTKFDLDKNGFISSDEFKSMWSQWIRIILWPKSALIIVDVQNDFISGSLSVNNCPSKHKGEEVVPVINNLLNSVKFDAVLYTLDWHPKNHISFIENVKLRKVIEINGEPIDATSKELDELKVLDTVTFKGPPKTVQRLWPKHCVQNTNGAELHSDLIFVEDGVKIYKGMNPKIDSYSAFWDNNKESETQLNKELKMRGITDVYVCGLAYDVCVQWTANHAIELGYRTVVIDDASRGVDIADIETCKQALTDKHSVVVNSNEVHRMVKAEDRRLELAYFLLSRE